MPKGVYKRKPLTEEHKRKIGESCKGNIAWNKGAKGLFSHSDEHKKKMSEIRKGKWKNSPETIEKIRVKAIGRGHTLESRLKMSESRKGKNHWNWNGGITPENLRIRNGIEIKLWRNSVFSRDGWICQKCKLGNNNLNAHHILPFRDFKELRTSIENGITLCKACHLSFHKKYGRYNNTREQINEYIS